MTNKKEALEMAQALYEGEFGNLPVIAEKLSMVTTLTRNKARKLLAMAVVEYIADLLQDYEGEE